MLHNGKKRKPLNCIFYCSWSVKVSIITTILFFIRRFRHVSINIYFIRCSIKIKFPLSKQCRMIDIFNRGTTYALSMLIIISFFHWILFEYRKNLNFYLPPISSVCLMWRELCWCMSWIFLNYPFILHELFVLHFLSTMSVFPSLTTMSVVVTNAFSVSSKSPLVFLTFSIGLLYFFLQWVTDI